MRKCIVNQNNPFEEKNENLNKQQQNENGESWNITYLLYDSLLLGTVDFLL